MTTTNIAEIKNHFSRYLKVVMNGETIVVCKRNLAVAKIIPVKAKVANKTKLGCGRESVVINTDLTEPAMEESLWSMFNGDKL